MTSTCSASKSMIVEAELYTAVSDVLTRLGFTNFAIRLNHRQILAAILDVAGVPAERAGDALVALDKLDKIGRDGVLQDMTARQIDEAAANRLLGLFTGGDGSSGDGAGTHAPALDAASNVRRSIGWRRSSAITRWGRLRWTICGRSWPTPRRRARTGG